MLKYTRWIASSAPIESSPPLRMWCTVSVAALRCQHLPSRPGSHQQIRVAPSRRLPTLRHLLTISPGNVGRTFDVDDRVHRARVVHLVGRDRRRVGRAGPRVREHLVLRACPCDMPEPRISEMREYWLPMAPLMFSHLGWAGSLGGFSGSNAMWHEPQAVPIRNGGSIEPSARRLTRESLLTSGPWTACRDSLPSSRGCR